MRIIRQSYKTSPKGRALMLGLMLLLCISTGAQTNGIVINGNVYGGGRNGAVGTNNASTMAQSPTAVQLQADAENNVAAEVKVFDGQILTIFGGGENGRTYGSTSVTIQGSGTTIGSALSVNTENGGVFGAGDGEGAYVFGHSNVLIKGGTIAQNVYGGGNKADLMGTTQVTLQGGTLKEAVYGGSRLANIYGYSLVNIDGTNAAQDLVIKAVYGGNDIAGHIEASNDWDWTISTNLQLPAGIFSHATTNGITSISGQLTVTDYNSFVHSSPEAVGKHIFVGQVFGGGNGDYGEYTYNPSTQKYTVSALGTTFTVASKPEVQKSYIELRGGTFGYVYGGGNNATVTNNVDICLDNSTTKADLYEIDKQLLDAMGVSTNNTFTAPTENTVKPTYQFDRVFGGNNKADMDLQPKWHLINGTINNLYSGGNEGNMTWKKGLLLELNAEGIEVNTVYGGCRRADVRPMENGADVASIPALEGYAFPAGLSARVLITNGTIKNVYGGNDISGNVVGGNALDIRSSILGDVYGGGNGSYAYTDNPHLANHEIYRDFYYSTQGYNSSAEALNAFRPNAQQAWIHVSGTADKPTLIGGSLYCGGNSATLSITENDQTKKAELNIGSYVIVDNVFLGSNGENMIDDAMLAFYDSGTVGEEEFSSINMTNENFAKYIEGVSLGIRPKVSFETEGYVNNTTQIGSFFLGGNLGSITASGTFDVEFEKPIIIYDKLVAGCNDANYYNSSYGIDYKGGIKNNSGIDDDGVKIRLNVNNVTLLPKKVVRNEITGEPEFDAQGKPQLVWNKTDISEGSIRLKGANIYGGCYTSGYINGGVEINLTGPAMSDDMIFDDPETQEEENSGIVKEDQQQDVFGRAMSIFGGGMGEKTEVWGNTTVNIDQDGYILQAFGGGERGIVGKVLGNGNYTPYNATVNLNGGSVDEIYGGGFEGLVTGNTTVNVLSGNAVDVFGGACNADVGGFATVYVGGNASGASNSLPVVQNVFGGNDYSGEIGSISGLVSKTGYNGETVLTNTYVEYLQGQVDSIFGGSYGSYTYPNNVNPPFIVNSFVNFKPISKNGNKVDLVFGGGWGDPSIAKNNEMQQRSYVLVNAPSNIEAFTNTDIFGSGAFSGLGMNKTPAEAAASPADVTAKVVLVSGKVNNVYGSSYKSGFTRRTDVVVPSGSTINVKNIFGGGYGDDLGTVCDTYEATVNYSSNDATVREAIYGGNNNSRRTLYSFVNVESTVHSNRSKGYTATVYGAGYGADTWTQYTEVNLKNGAEVKEVYGGGNAGMVLNKESENAFTTYTYQDEQGHDQTGTIVKTIGSGYDNDQILEDLTNPLVNANRLGKTTNTNVYIWKGATVVRYCYGGGLGDDNLMATYPNLGLVSGTTYIGVHGGTVLCDLYAAGTSGAINRLYTNLTFTPETNAYLEGGSVRNIYGGGWKGNVGSKTDNIVGNSYVVIGTLEENFTANETGYKESYGFYKGEPTVQRNAYAGGEGGAVYGMANLTMNSGRIGYEYTNGDYVEKIEDDTHVDNEGNLIPNTNLMDSGNIFGGGYKEESDVDNTNIIMWGGLVRNSLYGGGEIATVGHGEKQANGVSINKKGHTHVEMYNGQVLHDVFGGGKGYDNLGRVGERLHTDGYVFGSTEVYIYGGKVGTEEGAKNGLGNVFGGGNVGYVYSGDGTKGANGYYYNSNNLLTEDCKVVVSPYAKVLANEIELRLLDESGHEIANSRKTFHKNEYVPTEYLNCLDKDFIYNDKKIDKKLDWVTGVTIHNAVFAGGNVSSGSNVLYANTKTVFGNATATLNDVYHCDLITVGTEHIGGLYGDGNLTFVDGYRELNITNYGTDYYGQSDVITLEQYNEMNDRERAYFELKYKCVAICTDNAGNDYSVNSSLSEEDLRDYFAGQENIIAQDGTINSAYWVESGFCSIYAGRLLNTIQRADFVGVFGSRMVMQGSRDRVPSVVDYTDYTINRVGEVSLNQKHSTAGDTGENATFGNYFGIYNIVNHLGALTSDVDYYDGVRTTKNGDNSYNPDFAGQTYEEWKTTHVNDRKRNNGASANKVALAAGVYLELTTEESTPDNKVWGVATGVMELDLINVMAGLGGGYVYAKNVHGVRSTTNIQQVTLSKYNQGATSKKQYTYTTDDAHAQETQTSGNFVHSIKQIFDDCYPQSNSYTGADPAPAHYWFIKGQIYLYNQYISAYTGAAEAYSKTINIPLTVTAGSHGTLKIQNVQPNKYAYYSSYVDENNKTKLAVDGTKVVNDITYHLNDTITYWEWSMLSATDQKLFVDETYVTIADCEVGVGHTPYSKGYVLLPQDYNTLLASAETKVVDGESVKAVYHVDKGAYVAFTDVFRSSNNISHDNGYILTYDVTNPEDWNTYYSPKLQTTGGKKSTLEYSELPDANKPLYMKAPTYTPTTSKIYGQRHYNKGEIITQTVKSAYDATIAAHPYQTQEEIDQAAQFERAYVLTKKVTIQNPDGTESYLNAGYVMPYSEYNDKGIGADGAAAMYCTNTFELKREGYEDQLIYWGKNLTESQIEDLVRTYICYQDGKTQQDIDDEKAELLESYFTQSYYCTKEGLYGGQWFESGTNYSGLTAWSSLPAEDRSNFTFNYDALDLLIDPLYHGDARYYDTPSGNQATLYALEKPLDYRALYTGNTALTYTLPDGRTQKTIDPNDPNAELELSRTQFEDIPNERYHYAPFEVTDPSEPVYIVKESFVRGDVPYSVGNKIDHDTWSNLGDLQNKITVLSGLNAGKYYYCRDAYDIDSSSDRGTAVTNYNNTQSKTLGQHVPIGFIITDAVYRQLINLQTDFAIYGKTPIVTSTFYVSGQSNIKDLSKGRIITLIYQYNYEESDETGTNIEPITERHIVNIHINFKSGTPTIGQLGEPSIVLPGSSIGLTPPEVKPGAYEVIGGGWELFASKDEAEKHVNGVEFDNVDTKLYWYQNNGYHVSYYAKTYLGKTYSNPVPVKVANYHDLDMVMRDKDHHMYIDNPNVERNSKIYIDSRKSTADENKSKLDLLKDLFDLSLQQITLVNGEPQRISGGELDGHIPLDNHIKGGANLEFILRSDVAPKKYTTWNPIGDSNNGFMGTLHGDGYTISGLDHSLFGNLCDSVYNLGVIGSFTGSGIADLGTDGAQSNPKVGYAENCWIMTTASVSNSTQPVLGNGGVTKNCYYPENLTYATKAGTKAMPIKAFHNGEVAYNLNGFYLTKRYSDNNGVNTNPYKYYKIANNSTNTLESSPSTGYYSFAAGDAKYSYGQKENLGYVESRYMDGDFIYANGSIPTVANERRYYVPTPENGTPDPDNGLYYPIWPDDYIFFGQMLTYGYTEDISGREYQEYPSRINKADRGAVGESKNASQWLVMEDIHEFSNRVYRTPAYFGDKNPDIIHHNAYAVVPAMTSDNVADVYPGLTAIDFTALSDYNNNGQIIWQNGWSGDVFNKRVLDHTNLIAFRSDGQTKNLLAYAESENDADILSEYFNEPAYSVIDANYRNVAVVTQTVRGHLVMKKASGNEYIYEAYGNHYLVDKQDFNAPISYTFGRYASNVYYHMWYQRLPQEYVISSAGGWETICLPFTAELVTTQDKGEITHFYTSSQVGHEYWLREFSTVATDAQDNTKTNVVFSSPAAGNTNKTVTNTFLWDHYYFDNRNSVNATDKHKDKNRDTYQTYYNTSRTYSDYPLYAAGKPYLIGFPGGTYYEFDLSGNFSASNTATSPTDVSRQTVTFVSPDSYTVGVTDDEYTQAVVNDANTQYTFVPTYQTKAVGDAQTDVFMLADGGTKMVKTTNAVSTPFRAYLTAPAAQQQPAQQPAQSRAASNRDVLYISYLGDTDSMEETVTDRGLYVNSDNMNICIESTLEYPATVTITNVAGKVLKQFTIQPGTRVTVPVNNRGIYVVNRHKIAVTR